MIGNASPLRVLIDRFADLDTPANTASDLQALDRDPIAIMAIDIRETLLPRLLSFQSAGEDLFSIAVKARRVMSIAPAGSSPDMAIEVTEDLLGEAIAMLRTAKPPIRLNRSRWAESGDVSATGIGAARLLQIADRGRASAFARAAQTAEEICTALVSFDGGNIDVSRGTADDIHRLTRIAEDQQAGDDRCILLRRAATDAWVIEVITGDRRVVGILAADRLPDIMDVWRSDDPANGQPQVRVSGGS